MIKIVAPLIKWPIVGLLLYALPLFLAAQTQSPQWYKIISTSTQLHLALNQSESNAPLLSQEYSSCEGNQQWQFIPAESGYFYIQSAISDLYLEVVESPNNQGHRIRQQTENGTDAQQWAIESSKHGYFIRSKIGDLYLEVVERSKIAGGRIGLSKRRLFHFQGWTIYNAASPASPITIDQISYIGNHPNKANTAWSHNAQGLTHDDQYWYITQAKYLWKIPVYTDFNQEQHLERYSLHVKMPKVMRNLGYNHFGDLDYYKGYLFIPIEGRGGPGKNPALAVFRASDLRLVKLMPLTEWMRDAPWCAINPATGLLYTSNYNHIDPIYRFKIDIDNDQVNISYCDNYEHFYDQQCAPLQLSKIQGGTFSPNGRYLFLATGAIAGIRAENHGIWVFDHEEHRLISKSYVEPLEQFAKTDKNPSKQFQPMKDFQYQFYPGWACFEETEGITYWDLDHSGNQSPKAKGQLHVLLLDNSLRDNIYIKHYRLRPLEEFEE